MKCAATGDAIARSGTIVAIPTAGAFGVVRAADEKASRGRAVGPIAAGTSCLSASLEENNGCKAPRFENVRWRYHDAGRTGRKQVGDRAFGARQERENAESRNMAFCKELRNSTQCSADPCFCNESYTHLPPPSCIKTSRSPL